MKGIGIDTVAMAKFQRVVEAGDTRFYEHVYTDRERAYCENAPNPLQSFAGHFAAKEALFKALPALRSCGVDWHEMEVDHDAFGAPFFRLEGKLLANLARIDARHVMVSISHTAETAVAIVVVP